MKHPLTGVVSRTVARTSIEDSASIGKRTTNLNYVEHDDGRDNETNTRMQLKLLPAKRSKKASSSTTKMIFSTMITTKSCTLMLVLVLLCVGSCARANNRTTANQTNRAALISGAPAAASQSNNNNAPTDRRRAGGNQTSPARSSPKAAAAAHNSKPLEPSGGIEKLSEAANDNSSGGKLLTGPLASSGAIGRRPDLKSSELLDEFSRPVRDGFDATRDGLARFTSIPLAGGHSVDIEQRHQQQQQQNAYNEELSGFPFSNAPDDRSSFMFNPNDFQRPIAFTTSNSNPGRGPSSLARREEEKEKDKERPAAATSSPISRATIDNDNDGFASAARLQALSSGSVSGEIPHRFVNPTNGLRFPSALEPPQIDDGPALHYEQLASDPRHRAAAASGGGGIKVVFNNNPQFIIGRDQHADYNPSGQRDHAPGQSGLVNLAEHLHSRRSGASSTMDRDPDESRLDETKARPCDKDTTQQQQQQRQEKILPQISNLDQIDLSSPAEPVKPVAEPKQQPEPELKREPPAANNLPLSPPPPEIKTTRIEEPSGGDQEGQVITPFEQIVKSGLRPPLRLVISMRNKNGDTMKVPINLHGSPKRKSFDLAAPMQLHFEAPILEQKEDENTPAGGDVFDPSIVRPFSKTPAVAKTALPEKAPLSPALPPVQQKGLPPSRPTPAAQPQPQPPLPQPQPLTNKKELPPPTDVEPQIKVVAEPAPLVQKKYDCAEQQQSIEETKQQQQQQQQDQLAPVILGSGDGMLHMMVPESTPSRSKTFSSMLEQFQKALAGQMSIDNSQAFLPSSAGDAANQLAAKEQQERQKQLQQDDQEDLMVAMLAANVTSGGQQPAARQRMSMTVIKPPKGTTLSEAIRMHAQGGSPDPGRTVAILQSIGSRVNNNNNSNKNQAGLGEDAPLGPPPLASLSPALAEVGRTNDLPAPIATEIRLKQGGNRNPTQHRPAVGQANIGNGNNNNNINNVNNEPVDPDGFSASSNVRTFYRHLFGGLDDEEAAAASAGSGAVDGSASNSDDANNDNNNNNNFDASASFSEDDLGDVRRPNSSGGGGQAERVRRRRSSPAAGSAGDSKDSIAFAKSLEPSDKLPSAKLNSSSTPKIATTRPATVTTTTTTTTPVTTAMTSTLASTQRAIINTTTPAPPTKQAKLEKPNKSKASKQPGKEMKPKRRPAKMMGQQRQLMNKRMGSAGPSRGRGGSNLKDFFESAASEESEQRENEVPDYADDSAASDDDTVDASDSNDEPSSSNSAGNDYSSGSDSPDGDGSDDDSDLYSDGSGSSDESPDDEPFNQAAASSSPGGDYAASGSFEIPEIEINPNTLKQEGCRTVLKEVQEIPMNGLGAAASGEPAPQAGSNNMAGGGLRRLRRHSDNLINSRKVTSIVMTKECHFPSGGGGQSKPSANTVRPQPQTARQSRPASAVPQAAAAAPISMESANQGRLAPAPAAAPHHLSRQVNQANPTPARHHFERELAARRHQHDQMLLLQQQQQQQQRLLAGQQVRRSPAPTVAAQAAPAAQVNGAKMRRSVAAELQSAPRERNETPARDELGAASRRTEVIAQKLYKPPSADNPFHVLSISSKSGVDPDMESDEDDSFVMDSDNSGGRSAAGRPDKRRRQRQPEASASGRRLRMPQESLSERERKSLADPNYDDTDPVNQADEQEAASDGANEQRRRQQRDELEADEEQQRRPSSPSSSRRVAGGRQEPDADESDADLADESSNTRAFQVRQQQQQQLRLQQQPHQPAAPRQGGGKSQPPVPLGARLAEQARRMEAAAGAAAASLRQQPKQAHQQQQQLARRGAPGGEPAADQRFGRSFKFQHQLGRPQPSALMAQLQSLAPDRQGYVSISGAQLAPAAAATARRRSDESADPDEDEDSDVDEPDESSSQDSALSGAQSRASRAEPQAESEPDADPEYNPRESRLPAHTKPKRVQKSFAYVRRDLPRDGSPNSPDDFVVSYGRGNLQTEHEDYDSDREQPAGAAAANEQDDERRRRAASTQLASYSPPAQRAAGAVAANPLTRRHDSPVAAAAAAAGGFVRQHAQLTPADYLRRLTSHQQHQLARHNHHQQQLSAAAAAAAQQQQWQQPSRMRSLIGGGGGAARSGGMSA